MEVAVAFRAFGLRESTPLGASQDVQRLIERSIRN